MGFITVVAVVSMIDSPVTLRHSRLAGGGMDPASRGRLADPARSQFTAEPFGITAIPEWPIPWCTSEHDYAVKREHMKLLFTHAGSEVEYSIWQGCLSDGDFIRFTHGPRNGTGYRYPNGAQGRHLAADHQGRPFRVEGNGKGILLVRMVESEPLVILHRLECRLQRKQQGDLYDRIMRWNPELSGM